MTVRKSASFTVYDHHLNSTSSDTSTSSSSSSESSDTPLKRFNKIIRSSVARPWAYFRKDRRRLRSSDRCISDSNISELVHNDSHLAYLDISPVTCPRRSLQVGNEPAGVIPTLYVTSAGGSSSAVGVEEASDGSDAERPRRGHHLRVPTPAFVGQSTGNFSAGAAGGGCGAPRSAPATPLQLEPHPRTKHDKQTLKPLSGSAPSVRVGALASTSDTAEGKQPSKARQKKFMRHFPQVGPEERVVNYYSCALVGDLLLQGHLYITKNYFAFYSNVFGYVTKLLIPTSSVIRISKEKVARIIPNAVGVSTRDERHVFGSLLSRDAAYKLMTHVWKAARPELATPKAQDSRTSEVDYGSEDSHDEDSSSGAGDNHNPVTPPVRRDSETGISACATVIQPALLTGGVVGVGAGVRLGAAAGPGTGSRRSRGATCWRVLLVAATALLTISAALLSYKLYLTRLHPQEELNKLSGEEMYSELMRWRTRLHGRAANELHAFLTTNLLLLTKVRQSLETLSGVILTDMGHGSSIIDTPNETVFS
ncbi:uncharacterized protein LOC131854486 [Achroia grisella]|uniref:uncharacterized protein LOC131854486 n=1 Tax=Achroia grisella TaxID=688607 RepID=UPI0027D23E90|nr:uncharacterized protein LOC131854486 [Achroia grisella]